MVGIYAFRVIAGMANVHTLRDFTFMNLVRVAVCADGREAVPKHSVIEVTATSGPNPAITGFVGMVMEALFCGHAPSRAGRALTSNALIVFSA